MINRIGLDLFRERLGFNPYHFWGWADVATPTSPAIVPVNNRVCNGLLREYAWQAQSGQLLTRSEIRQALVDAERELNDWLGFPIAPRIVTETVTLYKKGDCHIFNTCWGRIDSIGEAKNTTLAASAPVTYSASNGGGLNDQWTVTIAGEYAAREIMVEFVAADLPAACDGYSPVLPICVAAGGGNTVISGDAWVMARPVLYEGYGMAQQNVGLDPKVAGNYAQTVKVTRRWVDTSVAPVISNDTCNSCGQCETCTASAGRGTLSAKVTDCRLGVGLLTGCASGNKATFSYWAGVGCGDCEAIDDNAAVMLAVALLKSPCCSCGDAQGNMQYHRWQEDRAMRTNEKVYLGSTVNQTPFGTKDGALRTWELVKRHRIGVGVRL